MRSGADDTGTSTTGAPNRTTKYRGPNKKEKRKENRTIYPKKLSDSLPRDQYKEGLCTDWFTSDSDLKQKQTDNAEMGERLPAMRINPLISTAKQQERLRIQSFLPQMAHVHKSTGNSLSTATKRRKEALRLPILKLKPFGLITRTPTQSDSDGEDQFSEDDVNLFTSSIRHSGTSSRDSSAPGRRPTPFSCYYDKP